jgi:small subunit ribosomal protein S18
LEDIPLILENNSTESPVEEAAAPVTEAPAEQAPEAAAPAAAPSEQSSAPRTGGYRAQQSGDARGRYQKRRRKVCQFCVAKTESIDYKDVATLRKFISERSKILPRRTTGTCAEHQRKLTESIKRARIAALIPFVTE